jgi:hypothetical protein
MKPKLLFVYDHEFEDIWRDGLWAAIELLKQDFDLFKFNIHDHRDSNKIHPTVEEVNTAIKEADFILGWGGFNSSVDQLLQPGFQLNPTVKRGLCLGGYALPTNPNAYEVVFYETEWSKKWFEKTHYHPRLVHAFGVNTDIFYEEDRAAIPVIWDYITVGAFANWKRQEKLIGKEGAKMAVGQIQRGNLNESLGIVANLLINGCGVSDNVPPETLAKMYNASRVCYIPANIIGGGERATLEARACGTVVEVEPDNPKLLELTTSPVWDHHYYAAQLKKGIEACL